MLKNLVLNAEYQLKKEKYKQNYTKTSLELSQVTSGLLVYKTMLAQNQAELKLQSDTSRDACKFIKLYKPLVKNLKQKIDDYNLKINSGTFTPDRLIDLKLSKNEVVNQYNTFVKILNQNLAIHHRAESLIKPLESTINSYSLVVNADQMRVNKLKDKLYQIKLDYKKLYLDYKQTELASRTDYKRVSYPETIVELSRKKLFKFWDGVNTTNYTIYVKIDRLDVTENDIINANVISKNKNFYRLASGNFNSSSPEFMLVDYGVPFKRICKTASEFAVNLGEMFIGLKTTSNQTKETLRLKLMLKKLILHMPELVEFLPDYLFDSQKLSSLIAEYLIEFKNNLMQSYNNNIAPKSILNFILKIDGLYKQKLRTVANSKKN